jgi:hypothetical protein
MAICNAGGTVGGKNKARFEFRGKFLAGEEWSFMLSFGPISRRILKYFAKCLEEIGIWGGEGKGGERGRAKTLCGRLLRGCGRGRIELLFEGQFDSYSYFVKSKFGYHSLVGMGLVFAILWLVIFYSQYGPFIIELLLLPKFSLFLCHTFMASHTLAWQNMARNQIGPEFRRWLCSDGWCD